MRCVATLLAAGLVCVMAAPGWAEPSQDRQAGAVQPGAAANAHSTAKHKGATTKPAQAPAPVAARTSGEVDSVNLPGVRLPGPKSRAGAVTRPVAGSFASSPAPSVPQAATGARPRDAADPDRKFPGGGVMTGDVSIGGPLGAGPFGR